MRIPTILMSLIFCFLAFWAGIFFTITIFTQKQTNSNKICTIQHYGDYGCYYSSFEKVKPKFEKTRADITVVWFDNAKQLRNHLEKNFSGDFRKTVGFSSCNWSKEECTIYVLRPIYVYGDERMDTLGHELYHALSGSFHD